MPVTSSLGRNCLHFAHCMAMVGYWAVGLGLGAFLMQFLLTHVTLLSSHADSDMVRVTLQISGEILCILGALVLTAAFIAFEFRCDKYLCERDSSDE
jgi:hypothetical protein